MLLSARLENVILCSNVRIGEKAQIKDCEFGTGFEAKAGGTFSSSFFSYNFHMFPSLVLV